MTRKKRFNCSDLPEGMRYVTILLRTNYQKVLFSPPAPRGIASGSVDNRPAESVCFRTSTV
jgi:hypothetical protein